MENQQSRVTEPVEMVLGTVGLLAALFIVIGSFGPWATTIGVGSISGLTDWGIVTLGLGVIGGIAAVAYILSPANRGWDALLMLIAFGLAGIIAAVSWIDISDHGLGALPLGTAGWGVQLAAWSALIGSLTAFVALMDWALAPDEEFEAGIEPA